MKARVEQAVELGGPGENAWREDGPVLLSVERGRVDVGEVRCDVAERRRGLYVDQVVYAAPGDADHIAAVLAQGIGGADARVDGKRVDLVNVEEVVRGLLVE